MKNIILILMLTSFTFLSFGQKLKKHEVDKLTGKTIKLTDWEWLNKGWILNTYIQLSKSDNSYFLGLKIIYPNNDYSVFQGDVLYFIFSDGEILSIKNLDYQIATIGAGAVGIMGSETLGVNLKCNIDNKIIEKLKEKTVAKVRVYTSEGYQEDKVKQKNANILKKMAHLINSN